MTAFECMLVDEYNRARRLIPGLEEEIAAMPKTTLIEDRHGIPSRPIIVRRSGSSVSVAYAPEDSIAEIRRNIELRRNLNDALIAFRKTMMQVERAFGCKPDTYCCAP